jgi:hypothetical protein
MFLFLGEFLCFALVFLRRIVSGRKDAHIEETSLALHLSQKRMLTNINPLSLILTAICDVIATTMRNLSLTIIHPSVF